jgi:hypothetical protein
MPDYLVVPVRVAGLWLSSDRLVVGATADFSRLPFTDGRRDFNADVANLSDDIVSQPFQDQDLYLKAGVHVHWTLPRGLAAERPRKSGAEFPAVPDRWLVTRWRQQGAQRVVEMAWVVESNYLHPDGEGADSGSIAFPLRMGHPMRRTRPVRYLGRKVPLDAWREREPSAEYLEGLTAVGHGDPTFAAFYPNCLSVFGLHDHLIGDRLAGAGYDVFGWYTDRQSDALWQFVQDFRPDWKRSGPDARIEDDLAVAVRDVLGWRLPRAPGDPFPERLLCLGRLEFKVSASVAEAASFKAPDTRIVLANTGTEALSVYLAARVVPPDRAGEVEDQLEALQLSTFLEHRRLDVGPKLAEGRHEKGFQAVGGGSLWSVRRESTQGGAQRDSTQAGAVADASSAEPPDREEETLSRPLAHQLNAVNVLQQQHDSALHEIVMMRRQLFADWYKFMICAHPPDDERRDYPDVDEVRHFIETKDLAPLRRAVASVGEVTVQVDDRGRLSASAKVAPLRPAAAPSLGEVLAGELNALQALLDAINASNDVPRDVRYVAHRISGPRYWAPREPVVLLVGDAVRPTWLAGGSAEIICGTAPDPQLDNRLRDRVAALTDHLSALVKGSPFPGLNIWESQPWDPFLLQWEAEVLPIDDKGNLDPATGDYGTDFITANFELPADGPELTLRTGRGGLTRAANIYEGTCVLTAQASLQLIGQLVDYLNDPQVDKTSKVYELMTTARKVFKESNFACLSQSLGGFNEALLMRKQTRQMEIDDPLAFARAGAFIDAVRDAIQGESHSAPQPLWDFNPIRTGGLRLRRLRLVDRFGRPKDLNCRRVETTAHRVIPDAPELIRLAPRVVQPARLNLRWLAAGLTDEEEMNDHPATSPICGWLLPNNLDGSLMVYDADGTALGFLDEAAHWRPMPGAPLLPIDRIANPYLRRTVKYLENKGKSFLGAFLDVVEDALEHIDPEGFARHPELALLLGRPIALARVSLGLELKGRPAVHQGWIHFRMDLRRAVRDTDDLTRVKFPIRLGEFEQFNDGLVGYWIEGADGIEHSLFYAPQSDEGGEAGIKTHADNPAPLCRTLDDPPLSLTVLLDPRGTIHATSGILPTKSIGIPPDQYAAALKKMEVVFLTAPVITGEESIEIPLPDEPGYAWTWATDPKLPLRPIDPTAIFARAQEIREGWLKLSPLPEE